MENKTKYDKFWSFAAGILKNSIVGKIILAVFNFLSALASGSFIFNIFNRGNLDSSLENSGFIKNIGTFFHKILTGFYGFIKNSAISKICSKGINCLFSSPVKVISCLFFPFFAVCAVFQFVGGAAVNSAVLLVLAVLTLLFSFSDTKIGSVVKSSFLSKFFCKIFALDLDSVEIYEIKNYKACIIAAAAGLIAGGLSFFSLVYSALAMILFIGFFFIFSVKPIVFGCIFMFSVPLLPTMLNVGIIFLFFANFILARSFDKIKEKKLNFVEIMTLLFMSFIVVSSLLSVTPGASVRIAAVWLVMITSFFAVRRCIESKEDLKSIMITFSIAAFITGVFGLYQYLSGQVDTTWTDTTLFEDLKLRIYSTFQNPNVYGEYLLLAIPVAVALIFLSKKKLGKLACVFLTGMLTVDLFLTYSRGCYIGLAVSIFMLIWLFDTRLIGFAAVLAVPAAFMLPSSITSRIMSITNLADSSTSYRVKIWHGTLRALKDFGITGVGIGDDAFNVVYPRYAFNGIIAPHSHSLFLQILISMGILAFAAFVIMLFGYFRNGISNIRRTKNYKNKILMSIFVAAMVGFLIQSIFDYTWYNYRVFMIFWIFLALGSTAFEICFDEEKKQ